MAKGCPPPVSTGSVGTTYLLASQRPRATGKERDPCLMPTASVEAAGVLRDHDINQTHVHQSAWDSTRCASGITSMDTDSNSSTVAIVEPPAGLRLFTGSPYHASSPWLASYRALRCMRWRCVRTSFFPLRLRVLELSVLLPQSVNPVEFAHHFPAYLFQESWFLPAQQPEISLVFSKL